MFAFLSWACFFVTLALSVSLCFLAFLNVLVLVIRYVVQHRG